MYYLTLTEDIPGKTCFTVDSQKYHSEPRMMESVGSYNNIIYLSVCLPAYLLDGLTVNRCPSSIRQSCKEPPRGTLSSPSCPVQIADAIRVIHAL